VAVSTQPISDEPRRFYEWADVIEEIERLEAALAAVRAERDRLILAIRSHAPKQADAIIDVAAVSSPGEEQNA
jgi:dihydropteroate synthase